MITDSELAQYRDSHYLRLVKEMAAELIQLRKKVCDQKEAIQLLEATINELQRDNLK